ncbi:lysine--tRNA ligase [Candidatus Woesearchaeota archaeon]|nr:lysine--tRNA ligase [Candidatus Woesearchaeota archaeon]
MPTEQELINERKRKSDDLRKLNINPYPYSYDVKEKFTEITAAFAELKPEEHTAHETKTAGRIISLRRMGKVTFMHLRDESGKLQLYFAEDILGKEKYALLKLFDMGDWLGVEGKIFKTRTGEVTVEIKNFEILCKSLHPLPEKWHGLTDIESRYRQRYVDLIMNPDVRETFKKRAIIFDSIRNFLNKKNFLEVDTPCLQPIYGGAAARPFKTHLNALNMDVFLRISNELYLKRLLVGGFERVYEFARDFRNEDIDRTHNPEFTQIEIYQAYADFEDMMNLTEDLYVNAAKKINGTTKIEFEGNKIDLKKPWKRMTMLEAIKVHANVDVKKLNDEELFALKDELKLKKVEGEPTRGKMIQALFEELVEDKLIQPTFITHHPEESTPLCKISRADPSMVERFEPFIAGMEVANGYSELNDPVKQRQLFEQQAEELKKGSAEAHPLDEDFLQAIEYGMPPTGGVGIGIDRMAMIITGQASIRDVLLFPFMKQ